MTWATGCCRKSTRWERHVWTWLQVSREPVSSSRKSLLVALVSTLISATGNKQTWDGFPVFFLTWFFQKLGNLEHFCCVMIVGGGSEMYIMHEWPEAISFYTNMGKKLWNCNHQKTTSKHIYLASRRPQLKVARKIPFYCTNIRKKYWQPLFWLWNFDTMGRWEFDPAFFEQKTGCFWGEGISPQN